MFIAKPHPINARAVYETAYRNARCVRSTDPRSHIIPIITTNPDDRRKVVGIVAWAIEQAADRNTPMMGWFSIYYENKFKARKQELQVKS